jgi:hypothetical protein
MTDHHLKAIDQAALQAALESAGILDAEGFVVDGYALDIIGTIYEPTGETAPDGDGNQIPVMVPVDGYHANLRGVLTTEQMEKLPLIAAPNTPYRVWA